MKRAQFFGKIVILALILMMLSSLSVFAAPPSQQNQNVTVTNTTSNPVPVTVTNAGSSAPARESLGIHLENGAMANVTFPQPAIIELVAALCGSHDYVTITTSYPVTATVTSAVGSVTALSGQYFIFETTVWGSLNSTNVIIPTTPTTNGVSIHAQYNPCDVSIVYRYQNQ